MTELAGLSKAEVERYSRQIVLPELGPEGQRKLKSSSVVLVGTGGLGIPASTYLTAAGVGTIGIIDDDRVEKSNLHRQPLYSESDVGRAKVAVARERLQEVNPYVEIIPFKERLNSSNALRILEKFDVVVDCTDNFPARYLVNDACVMLHKPDVYASIFRFDGQASVFDADRGPCYRCLYPRPPPPDSVQDCAVAGVLGVLPGIMGSIQAAQTISLLRGKGESLVGRLLLMDATDMTFTELKIKKDPTCPVCGTGHRLGKLIDYDEFCGITPAVASEGEVTPAELKRWLEEGKRPVLLDVREHNEYEICHLEGSKLVPMGELPRRMNELNARDLLVVYCHVGVRSSRAVEFLRAQGFKNAHNLRGGISAWAEEVDPKMPRY